jgi:hypothetical protein
MIVLAVVAAGCPSEPEPAAQCTGQDERDGIAVVWLEGTPYEMGYQHGETLHEELAQGVQEFEDDFLLSAMLSASESSGMLDLAMENSYPEVIEECEGLIDATADVGWTMEMCMVLNFGDVVAEALMDDVPDIEDIQPGCAQVIAAGPTTSDGRLYHARILDWFVIDFVLNNPVVFVRRPEGGIPHVVIGFPANLSPYQGMNLEGISVASNEVHILDNTVHDRSGRSHVQMVGRILAEARSLDDAREMITGANHMTLETIVVGDGETGEASIFEMAPAAVAERPLDDGVSYATNHFVAPATAPLDQDPPSEHSLIRFERLQELLAPGEAGSLNGDLAPETLVELMRDRINPRTGLESPIDEFDDEMSLATNGALFQLVFDPERLLFWLAAGALPVPQQTFVGFSLEELLCEPGSSELVPNPIL